MFKEYIKKQTTSIAPIKEWLAIEGNTMDKVAIGKEHSALPKEVFDAGYIGQDKTNLKDIYYIPRDLFINNYTEAGTTGKTLHNTDASGASVNVKDIVFWGDGDTFQLISKASSKKEGWMKSTKAMQIPKLGCVIQITTQQGNNVSETCCFVPGAIVQVNKDENGKVLSRVVTKGGY